MTTNNDIKIVTLGNTSVGKSSFIIKYIDNRFTYNYTATLGLDFKQKKIKLKDGKDVRLRIFDTAGQERFRSVSVSFIKKADGIILIYDISNRETFNSIGEWIKNIREIGKELLPVVLVGNKCDLPEEERKVTSIEGEEKADQFKIPFFETSCKDGINIKEAFDKIVEEITTKSNWSPNGEFKTLKKGNKNGKKCC